MVYKAMEQRFYCCSLSWSHYEAKAQLIHGIQSNGTALLLLFFILKPLWGLQQWPISHSMFKTTSSNGLSSIHCYMSICWSTLHLCILPFTILRCGMSTNLKISGTVLLEFWSRFGNKCHYCHVSMMHNINPIIDRI